jgi:hypothetical protein
VSDVIVALAGVVAGALANGGIQTVQYAQDRKRAAKVAARLILGDLYIAEHGAANMIKHGYWPPMGLDFDRELGTWNANREAFAAATDATDWTTVAVAYQDLEDLPAVATPGQPFTTREKTMLDAVRQRLAAAGEVAAKHAAPKRERSRVVKELGTRTAS